MAQCLLGRVANIAVADCQLAALLLLLCDPVWQNQLYHLVRFELIFRPLNLVAFSYTYVAL